MAGLSSAVVPILRLIVVVLLSGLMTFTVSSSTFGFCSVAFISSDTQSEDVVVRVGVTSDDSGFVSYSVEGGNGSAYFNFSKSQPSTVILIKDLPEFVNHDSDVLAAYNLTVKVVDSNGTSRRVEVDIYVVAPGDQRLAFPDVITSSEDVVESQSPGFVFNDTFQPPAMHFDQQTVEIVSGDTAGRFRINSSSGELQLVKTLDRETEQVYILSLGAVMLNTGCTESFHELTVTVEDVNDNAPEFLQHVYYANISEISSRVLLVSVSATDIDQGSNAEIKYGIALSSDKLLFDIDEQDGQFFFRNSQPLDYETKAEYQVTVVATDKGRLIQLNGTAIVVINVIDENDNVPKFPQLGYTIPSAIPEDTSIGSSIFTVSASDLDSGVYGKVTYGISGGNRQGIFAVNSTSGVVFLAKQLDYENATSHQLSIQGVDGGGKASVTTLDVTVADINEAPVFANVQYFASVMENLQGGTFVLTVSSGDPDIRDTANSRVTYEIEEGNSKGRFSIDGISGEIQTTKSLDREETASYNLTVIAVDGGSPMLTGTAYVVVSIGDMDDNAPMVHPSSVYEVYLNENEPAGTSVLTVGVIDADSVITSPLKFNLFSLSVPQYFQFIDENNGTLSSLVTFDRESSLPFDFTFSVIFSTEKYGRAKTPAYTVHIQDINDHSPIFLQNWYEANVMENEMVGVHVVNVSAVDMDVTSNNSEVTYIIEDSKHSSAFLIDSVTGEITIAAAVDREADEVIELNVTAIDNGSPSLSNSTVVMITVVGVNDVAPVFERDVYTANISESASVGVSLLSVKANDGDADNSHKIIEYSIETAAVTQFRVDKASGIVTLLMPLDREMKDFYEFSIKAENVVPPYLSNTTTVQITVVDANDEIPVFPTARQDIRIPEDLSVGTVVYNATAIDKDLPPNNVITYELVLRNSSMFNLSSSTGAVTLIGSLDRDLGLDVFHLKVQASDGKNTSPQPLLIVITVIDVNDNSPKFNSTLFSSEVRENNKVGVSVVRLIATDLDSGNNSELSYSIIRGNDIGLFSVDAKTGVISLLQSLDYETLLNRTVNLTLMVEDNGIPRRSGTAIVSIQVLDGNDFSPEFANVAYKVNVSESSSIGSVVVNVSASDRDGGIGHLHYFLADAGQKQFKINEASGTVTVLSSLDREVISFYKFDVIAVDEGTPAQTGTVTLEVTVLDVNDNPPQFIFTSMLSVPENACVGTVVGTVQAYDVDEDQNAEVSYSIVTGNYNDTFEINSTDGQISVARSLDAENVQTYVLGVYAEDHGIPSLCDRINVTISVEDVNDNAPVFVVSNYSFIVSEGAVLNTTLGSISAVDHDDGSNGVVFYSLTSVSPFAIDSLSGNLTVNGTIDFEKKKKFTLIVEARDGGDPMMTSSTVVFVKVRDINDNVPTFSHDEFFFNVSENALIGEVVAIITANDADEGSNGKVEYRLLGNASVPFEVDPSGMIRTTAILDHEDELIYTLQVEAFDLGLPRRSANVTLIVSVRDVDEFFPLFLNSPYNVELTESAAVGSSVFQVIAEDQDASAHLLYFILTSSYSDFFDIDSTSGVVTLQKAIDYEDVSCVCFEVTVYDELSSELKFARASVSVHVLNVNDNPPEISNSNLTVRLPENVSLGHMLANISAFDPDNVQPKQNQDCDCTSTDFDQIASGAYRDNANHSLSFFVRHSTDITVDARGIVRTNRTYDREQEIMVTYEIIVSDEDNLFSTAYITLLISDINDNSPVFSAGVYNVSVEELATFGTPVVILSANDADIESPNKDFRFRIEAGNDDHLFTVNSTSGLIFVATGGLGKPLQQTFNLTVRLYDLGIPSLESRPSFVLISVTDINDNLPMFVNASYSVNVREDTIVGSSLITISATDADQGSNAAITYVIVSGNTNGSLEIHPSSGEIRTRRRLDYEATSVHVFELVVMAVDGGIPSLNASVVVSVTVIDINDNVPHAAFIPSVQTFNEDELQTVVGSGFALTDQDDNVNFFMQNATAVLFVSGSLPATYIHPYCQVQDTSLTMYRMCGITGAFDLSGNTFQAARGVSVEQETSVLTFDGTAHAVSNETVLIVGTSSSYTISGWVNVSNSGGSVVSFVESGSGTELFDLSISENVVHFAYQSGSTWTSLSFNCSVRNVQVDDENWHFLVIVFEPALLSVVLYVDGTSFSPMGMITSNVSIGSGQYQLGGNGFSGQMWGIAVRAGRIMESDVVCMFACEESLYIDGSGIIDTFSSVYANYEERGHIVKVIGAVTVAECEALFQTMNYINKRDEPGNNVRKVSVKIYDGRFTSQEAILTLYATLVNDNPPSLELQHLIVRFEEDGEPVPIAQGAVVTDNDEVLLLFPIQGVMISIQSEFVMNIQDQTALTPCPMLQNASSLVTRCQLSQASDWSRLSLYNGSLQRLQTDTLEFDGSSSTFGQVEVAESMVNLIGNWTIAGWYNAAVNGSGGTVVALFNASDDLLLRVSVTSDMIMYRSQRNTVIARLPPMLEPGTWHYLAVVYELMDLKVYVDGAYIGGGTVESDHSNMQQTANVFLGGSPGNAIPFHGKLWGLIFVNVAWNQQDMACTLLCGQSEMPSDVLSLEGVLPLNLTALFLYSSQVLLIHGTSTTANYTSAVNMVRFANTNDEPPGNNVSIRLQIFDGKHYSSLVSVDVHLVLRNDQPPVLDLNGADVAGNDFLTKFVEDGPPAAVVNSSLILTDADGGDFPLAYASVIITNGQDGTSETLAVDKTVASQIRVTYYSFNYTLHLGGPASLQQFEVLLKTLTYKNTVDDPTPPLVRNITVLVQDSNPSLRATAACMMTLLPTNDEPKLSIGIGSENYTLQFVEGSMPRSVVGSVVIDDPDDRELVSATVEIINPQVGDKLLICCQVVGLLFSGNGTSMIHLSNQTLLLEYERALSSISFVNDVDNPAVDTRLIRFIVADTIQVSNRAFAFITFVAVNDPPELDLSGPLIEGSNFTTVFEESGPLVGVVGLNATIMDSDDFYLLSASVCIVVRPDGADEFLYISNKTNLNLTVHMSESDGRVDFTGRGLVQEYEEALKLVFYSNVAAEPTRRTRQLVVEVGDSENVTFAFTLIEIRLVNDPPVLDLNSSDFRSLDRMVNYVENSDGIQVIDSNAVSISDVDSAVIHRIDVFLVGTTDGIQEQIVLNAAFDTNKIVMSSSVHYISLDFIKPLNFSATVSILSSFYYVNRADEPSSIELTRSVIFRLYDGQEFGNNATVFVDIALVNDNIPVFNLNSYSVAVYENITDRTPVVYFNASDRDVDNTAISYIITTVEGVPIVSPFTVETETVVTNLTGSVLDREKQEVYRLVLVAIDSGIPPRMGSSNVTIVLLDVNDNAPVFHGIPSSSVLVSETAAVGKVLFVLSATDDDVGLNGNVSFYITSGNTDHVFELSEATGQFRLQSHLDYEEKRLYFVTVAAVDSGYPSLSTEANITLSVEDANDVAPMFVGLPYKVSVLENDPGRQISQVRAIDEEGGVNGMISYSIIDGNSQNLFAINRLSGALITVGGLDRETAAEHMVTIAAIDGGKPSLNASTTIEITVLDQNDNPPMFGRNLYMGSVKESQPQEQTVAILTITDQDSERLYSFNISFTDRQSFYVEADSKNSSVAYFIATAHLDREVKPNYMVQVTVVDSASPKVFIATTDVFVNVLDINDNSPVFQNEPYKHTLLENVTVGTTVFAVYAVDQDHGSNSNVSYKLITGNIGGVFDIKSESGIITVVSSLDHEARNSYRLTVEVCDDGDPQQTATTLVEVTIEDVNDNVPVFTLSHYQQQVSEQEHIGFSVLTVSASDEDEGMNGNVSYSLDSTTVFAVDSESGVVTIMGALDYETQQIHNFTVIATDNGIPSLSQFASVTVFVLDHNDNAPTFSQMVYTANVKENLPNGTFVANLFATDRDRIANNSLLYSFELSSTGSLDKFSINRTSGQVTTLTALDRETQPRHELRVSAYDGQQKGYTNLIVLVSDVNDHIPSFLDEPIVAYVTENQSPNQFIIQLRAKDGDEGSNSQLEFSINDSYSNTFFINQSSGEVWTVRELDRELQDVYMFLAVVHDQGNPSLNDSTIVEIRVQDINDEAPVFTKSEYTLTVPENIPSLTSVVRVEAVDDDVGSNAVFTYRIVTFQSDSFIIDSMTGSITTFGTLDREKQGIFNLTVEAVDNGQPAMTGTATVVISLMDINDNVPQLVIFPSQLFVKEDEPVGTVLLFINATDLDVGVNGNVQISLVGGNVGSKFNVTPDGLLSLARSLDRELISSYTLTLQAKDGGLSPSSSTADLLIEVIDVDDNDPVFMPKVYLVLLREDSITGSSVVQVTAEDADYGSNAEVYYTLLSHLDIFVVNRTSGLISTNTTLDRETTPEYNITVAANGLLTSVATVRVTVQDVNDESPVFDQRSYMTNVSESASVGTVILTVAAVDADAGANGYVTYTIIGGNEERRFDIDRISGDLFITVSLDYETTSSYMLTVRASDGAIPSHHNAVTVTVTVRDANDNAPKFNQSLYKAVIPEDSVVGSTLAKLLATDDDSGANGEVSYRLDSNSSLFAVDPSTGLIYLTASLDYEMKTEYVVTVVGYDHGDPALTEQVNISVIVSDVNDNPPFVFVPPNVTNDYQEHGTAIDVADKLSVADLDSHGLYFIHNATVRLLEVAETSALGYGLPCAFVEDFYKALVECNIHNRAIDLVSGSTRHGDVLVDNRGLVSLNGGYIEVPNKYVYHLVSNGRLSVSLWMSSETQKEGTLLSRIHMASGLVYYDLTYTSSEFVFKYLPHGSSNNSDTISVSCPQVVLSLSSLWHYVGVVIKYPILTFYVDNSSCVRSLTHPLSDNIRGTLFVGVEQPGVKPLIANLWGLFVTDYILTVEDVSCLMDCTAPRLTGRLVLKRPLPFSGSIRVSHLDDERSLLFEGIATVSEYTHALRQVQYHSQDEEPYSGLRQISFVVHDGRFSSPATITNVSIVIYNDNSPELHKVDNPVWVEGQVSNIGHAIGITDADADLPNIITAATAALSGSRASSANNFGCKFEFKRSRDLQSCDQRNATDIIALLLLYGNAQLHDGVLDLSNEGYAEYNLSVLAIIQQSVTFSLFLKTQSADGFVFGKFSLDGLFQYYSLNFMNSGQEIVFGYHSSSVRMVTIYWIPQSAVSDGKWHHVAVVIDYPDITLFIDGVAHEAQYVNDTVLGRYSIPLRHQLTDGIGKLRIGAESSGVLQFYGQITRFEVWTNAVDQRDIDCIIGCGEYLALMSMHPLITVTFASGFRTVKMNGTAPVQVYATLLSSLAYSDHVEEPVEIDRHLSVQVFNREEASNSLMVDISVQLINDQTPELDLDSNSSGNDYATSFEEGGHSVRLVGSNFSLTDSDSGSYNISSVIVNITNPLDGADEVVTAATEGTMIVAYRMNYTLVLTGPASLDDFREVVATVVYFNSAPEPSDVQRVISFVVVDTNTTLQSSPVFATVNIKLINDPPMLVFLADPQSLLTFASYNESDGKVHLIPRGVKILDLDNSTMHSVSVSLLLAPDGGHETLGIFGSLPSGLRVSFTNNTLVVTGDAAISEYEAIFQLLYYENTDDNPTEITRQITVVVSDGLLFSETRYVMVSFSAVNNPPELDINGIVVNGFNFSAVFTEGDNGIAITSSDSIILDVDSRTLSLLRVRILNLYDMANEWLYVVGSQSNIVCDYNYSDATLQCVGNATFSEYQGLLRTLQYNNSAEEPSAVSRIIEIQATDLEGDVSSPVYSIVDIVLVNDPPSLSIKLTRVPVFTEGGPGIKLLKNEAVSITDNDNMTFGFVEVIIQEPLNRQLEFVNASFNGVQSTRSDVGATSRFYFSFVNDSLHAAAFVELLRSLVYNNIAPEPLGEQRMLEIRISDGKDLSHPIVMQLLINETNGFTPMLLNFHAVVDVFEDASVGHVIDRVQALDGDGSDVIFALLPDDVFVIDRLTGVITLNRSLDRESVSNYTLTVIATDRGSPARSVSQLLVVMITDVNDNKPVFVSRSDRISVRESEVIGYTVTIVEAHDSDSGDNGQVTYSIESGDIGKVFALNQTSGELTVANRLDRETTSTYSLTVLAHDHGLPVLSTSTSIRIDVLDVNDNAPQFSHAVYVMSVDENQHIGAEVGRVSAVDADAGRNGNITFSIVFGVNITFPEFVIDSLTGVLTARVTLDRETRASYSLVVLATDMDLQPLVGNATVNITVNDVNDNSPEFTHDTYLANVSEAAARRIAVGSVTAKDADLGMSGLIVYSIKNGSGIGLFDVGRSNGTISLRGGLDRESVDSYTLFITAIDQGTPSLTSQTDAFVVISVLDVNDNPPVFELSKYTAMVEENAPVGTSIIQVSAIDNDSGSNALLSYSTSPTDVNSYRISVNQTSGLVAVNSPFDFERDSFISLSVLAKDSGNASLVGTAVIEITVLDLNDNVPQFGNQNYVALIQENEAVGYTVLQVNATDRDSGTGGEITYSIVTQIPSGYFSVDATTGAITLTKSLNFESSPTHNVRIKAEDNGKPSNFAIVQVIIDVINVNDVSPQFVEPPYFATVKEELPPDTFVVQVSAIDPDNLNGTITYSIDDSDASNNFSINATTGVISTAKVLDREMVTQLQIVVRAVENGDLTMFSTVLVTIRIEDINDHPPVFSIFFVNVSVAEDTKPGSTVFTVFANDADAGVNSKVRYHVLGGSELNLFDVDSSTGVVSVNKSLDREVVSNYSLVLEARDGGDPMLTAEMSVVILVTDVNDNSPNFTQDEYHLQISESASVNTTIGKVLAVDLDLGSNGMISYSFASVDLFRIDSFSGTIYLNGKLDYENMTTHSIVVFAHDFGKPQQSSQALVVVQVTDSNDNGPMFTADLSTYTAYISESNKVDVAVLQVSAVDEDAGTNSQITYHMQNLSLPIPFAVDSVTGVVTNTLPLDREATDLFAFIINAIDGGNPAQSAVAMVSVYILDINDNHPVFDRVNYTFVVQEDETVGSPIGQVVATDVDLGENGTVTYRYNLSDSTFNVTATTGLVVIASSLDHDKGSVLHEFLVEASDSGSVSLSSFAIVRVIVTDVNDNKPVIDLDTSIPSSNNYQTSFVEQSSGPVPIVSKNVTIFDEDVVATVNLSSLSVTLLNNVGSEDVLLSVRSSVFDVHITIGPNQHSAFLRGPAPSTAFVMALQYLRYNNTNSRNPQQFPERIIRFDASDGLLVSKPVNTTVRIVTVPDPPFLFMGIGQQNSSVEVKIGTHSAHIAEYANVDDPDSNRLMSAVITLRWEEGNETLTCDTTGTNITAVIYATDIILTGVDFISNYTFVLRSVQYLNYNLSSREGRRLVEFIVRDDSGKRSVSSFVTIDLVETALVDLNGIASGLDYSIVYKEMDGKRTVTSQHVRVVTLSGIVDAVNITLESAPDGTAETLTVESHTLLGTKLVQLPYSSVSRQLVILGPDRAENFEKALLTVRYQNTKMKSIINDQPSLETRRVSFVVTESSIESPSSTTSIEFSQECNIRNAGHTSTSLYVVRSTSHLQALSLCHSIIGSGLSVQCLSSCNIASLTPLMSLQTVKTLELKSLSITSLAGLGSLMSVDSLLVEDNMLLTTLDGFSQRVMSLSNDLVIKSNPLLVSINGLSSFRAVSGKVQIQGNALKTLTGLTSLQTIGQDLIISVSNVETLEGLQNLTTIGRILFIYDNSRLLSVDALSNLKSIGRELHILFNAQLLSLDGLHNVVSIGRALLITGNSQLCYMNGRLIRKSDWIGVVAGSEPIIQLSKKCQLSCSAAPCENNANCSDLNGGGFHCSCPKGYSGLTCSSSTSGTSGVSFALNDMEQNQDNIMVTMVVIGNDKNMDNLGERVGLVIGSIMEKFLNSQDIMVLIGNVDSSEDTSQIVFAVLQDDNSVPASRVIEALDSIGKDKLSHEIGLSVVSYFSTGGEPDGALEPKDLLIDYRVILGVAVTAGILIVATVLVVIVLIRGRSRDYNYGKVAKRDIRTVEMMSVSKRDDSSHLEWDAMEKPLMQEANKANI